jgi:hypothetical protein
MIRRATGATGEVEGIDAGGGAARGIRTMGISGLESFVGLPQAGHCVSSPAISSGNSIGWEHSMHAPLAMEGLMLNRVA